MKNKLIGLLLLILLTGCKFEIQFTDPPARRRSLGHGFRVETQIVVWENNDALTVPSSALFRQHGSWAVFKVEDGSAKLMTLRIGHNNGTLAEVLEGVEPGDTVILYPGPSLINGTKVTRRSVE